MHYYRTTKYNPIFRNHLGVYQKNEWTSYSDIGNVYDNIILIPEDYLKIENAYIEAISLVMKFLNIKLLNIKNLEKSNNPPQKTDYFYDLKILNTYNMIKNNMHIDNETVLTIARLCLRENLWCKIESDEMCIHFGWDYYMYIGTKNKITSALLKKFKSLELYIEEIEKSPYCQQY